MNGRNLLVNVCRSETEDGRRPVGTHSDTEPHHHTMNHDYRHVVRCLCASKPQPAHPHYTNRASSRPTWTHQCVAKCQERKRWRAQRTQEPATVALFITSPGFEEDGGSNSSPKQPSLERSAIYSLMNKSANALQSDGKGTGVKPQL